MTASIFRNTHIAHSKPHLEESNQSIETHSRQSTKEFAMAVWQMPKQRQRIPLNLSKRTRSAPRRTVSERTGAGSTKLHIASQQVTIPLQ